MIISVNRFLALSSLTVVVLAGCAPSPAGSPAEQPPAAAPTQSSAAAEPGSAALTALDSLPVAAESAADDYDRNAFAGWLDTDSDGCSTRAEILLRDAQTEPAIGAGCELTGGVWVSSYDQRRFTNSSDLDIDHIVPLLEFEQSQPDGARPGDEVRDRFSNDPANLVAVSAGSNRSKGAADVAEWMPPDESAWCGYATAWVEVKDTYRLTVDPAELDALRRTLTTAC